MNTKIEQFFTFIMEEKTRNFFAFAFYVSFIVMSIGIDLPLALKIIQIFIMLFSTTVYIGLWTIYAVFEKNRVKLGKSIIPKIKKIQ